MSVLETPRLELRAITLDDEPAFYRIFNDAQTMRYLGGTRTHAATKRWIEQQQARYEHDGFGPWALVFKDGGRVIGYAGLVRQRIEGRDEVEVAYCLESASWGQGLATEAAKACRDYAFGTLDLPKVVSIIDTLNASSQALARRLGMTAEKHTFMNNKTVVIYAVDRETIRKG